MQSKAFEASATGHEVDEHSWVSSYTYLKGIARAIWGLG